ncbi:FAD-dependent oxidoreductase [Gorillibacterium timonense]|uniref:FAD-dependent oxidoreductase n=1 Tax=Gorillibacterium timonense TaxID=1689269 RepID=UPI00071D68CD|nr:FAD-dependent oxidoreductase [Gorillibacterium timonense]
MEAYSLNRSVPLLAEADIVVIGGGPAGIAASIAAARCGKKVIVAEHSGQLGGMGTLANVSVFMPVGNVTGIYREIVEETLPESLPDSHDTSIAPQYNPFLLRHYFNEKLEKENVKVLFHTTFISAVKERDRVTAVIVHTREGLFALKAAVFIDGSGDGAVAIDAGADYTTGREEDGLTQPMTLMFMMQNTGKPVQRSLPEGCYTYSSVEELPQGRHLYWERNSDGTMLVNMTRVKGNGSKVEEVSFAEKESLRQALSVADYLQRNGFETYTLSHIPGQIGVRETNQIVGRYTLTEQDIVEGRRFADVVAQTNYEIDIHSPDGKRGTDERRVDGYDIPYRCMIPAKVEGLLVAGRSISATHVAMSSMRVQATCFALGQAAGIAASLSIDTHCPLPEVSMTELHRELGKQGVRLLKEDEPVASK